MNVLLLARYYIVIRKLEILQAYQECSENVI